MTDERPLSHRDVDRLETALRDLAAVVNALRGEMADTYVRKDVYERDLAAVRDDVQGHSDNFKWIARLVLATVVVALLGLLANQTGGFQ